MNKKCSIKGEGVKNLAQNNRKVQSGLKVCTIMLRIILM